MSKKRKKMTVGERVLQMVLVLPVVAFFAISALNNPEGAMWFLIFIGMMLIPSIPIAMICHKSLNYDKKHDHHGYRYRR